MSDFIVKFVDRLRSKPKFLGGLFLFILGAIVFFDFTAERHVPHFFGDRIRGFWAVFGCAGAILMTKFMKGIGHAFIMKPTDFYSGKDKGEDV